MQINEVAMLTEAKADTEKLIAFAGEDLANRFLAIKTRLKAPENDLYYWIKNKTVDELEQTVSDVENKLSTTKYKKQLGDNGAKLISENDFWKVYYITTFEASQKYGRDTKWCITGVDGYGDKYWKEYTEENNVKFYFFITKGTYDARGLDSKYALAAYPNGKYEIFDQQDYSVEFIPNADGIEIPEIELKHFDHDGFWYSGDTLTRAAAELEGAVVIPNKYIRIASDAFSGCSEISSIKIPDSVIGIGERAFRNCSLVQRVDLSKNLKFIEDYAFAGCANLLSIIIPAGVKKINAYAFSNCSRLSNIILSKNLLSIEDCAFYNCKKLKHVEIPVTVKSIGDATFKSCINLKSITLPKSIKVIGWSTFAFCSSLQSVELPESVTKIEDMAFSNCIELKNIVIPDSVTYIGSTAFSQCRLLTITCSKGSYAEKYAKEKGIPVQLKESLRESIDFASEFKLYEKLWE